MLFTLIFHVVRVSISEHMLLLKNVVKSYVGLFGIYKFLCNPYHI